MDTQSIRDAWLAKLDQRLQFPNGPFIGVRSHVQCQRLHAELHSSRRRVRDTESVSSAESVMMWASLKRAWLRLIEGGCFPSAVTHSPMCAASTHRQPITHVESGSRSSDGGAGGPPSRPGRSAGGFGSGDLMSMRLFVLPSECEGEGANSWGTSCLRGLRSIWPGGELS